MNRRELVGAIGVSATTLLAGCSGGSESSGDGSERRPETSAGESSNSLPRLSSAVTLVEEDEYDADAVTVRTFAPSDLASVESSLAYLRRLDAVIPPSLDVDVAALAGAVVTMDGTLVELTAPADESFESTVSGLDGGTEQIGSFALYSAPDGVVAVDGRWALLARPDEALSLSPRELLTRVIEGDSAERSTTSPTSTATAESPTTDRQTAITETLAGVETDHLRSLAVPLGSDTFGTETRFVPGARAVAWGLTVDESLTASTVETRLATRFPDGEAETQAVVDALPEGATEGWEGPAPSEKGYVYDSRIADAVGNSEFAHVNAETASVEETLVTVSGSVETSEHDGPNPYLRPRGVDDLLLIEVTATQYEFQFDYPQYDVSGESELVVPTGRPVVFSLRSNDVLHGFYVEGLDVKQFVVPGISRFGNAVEPTETGEYTVYCSEYCGAAHSTMQAPLRVTDSTTFRDWIDAR